MATLTEFRLCGSREVCRHHLGKSMDYNRVVAELDCCTRQIVWSHRAKASLAQLEELVVFLGAEIDVQWVNLPLRLEDLLAFLVSVRGSL